MQGSTSIRPVKPHPIVSIVTGSTSLPMAFATLAFHSPSSPLALRSEVMDYEKRTMAKATSDRIDYCQIASGGQKENQ